MTFSPGAETRRSKTGFRTLDLDTGGDMPSWLSSILGGTQGVASFLGKNAGTLGSLASILGGAMNARTGANAAQTAADQQANALNRGIDLQTAQWMQQQAQQAPWMEAGREALGHMRGRMAWNRGHRCLTRLRRSVAPTIRCLGRRRDGRHRRWMRTPMRGRQEQGPRAADYRYTPGQTPDAAPVCL